MHIFLSLRAYENTRIHVCSKGATKGIARPKILKLRQDFYAVTCIDASWGRFLLQDHKDDAGSQLLRNPVDLAD